MSEDELKRTFVARQALVAELISLVEHQPQGAGVQHVVIIAPRGIGKTTILLMICFAIADRGLATMWQAARFPEESYGINSLVDFWMKVLELIRDKSLQSRVNELKAAYPDNADLEGASLALLRDWSRQCGKRLLLLVDNFDMILEQINDERDNARLRDVLMEEIVAALPRPEHPATPSQEKRIRRPGPRRRTRKQLR